MARTRAARADRGAFAGERARLQRLSRGSRSARWSHQRGFWHNELVPVHYLYRSVSDGDLIALYRAADVDARDTLRDGMTWSPRNCGCALRRGWCSCVERIRGRCRRAEACDAGQPVRRRGTAEAYHQALTMSRAERRERTLAAARVFKYDVHTWVGNFLRALDPQARSSNAACVPLPASLWILSPSSAVRRCRPTRWRTGRRYPRVWMGARRFCSSITTARSRRSLHIRGAPSFPRGSAERSSTSPAPMPVVVLSGRGREDLISKVGLRGVVYAGSHGFDISTRMACVTKSRPSSSRS